MQQDITIHHPGGACGLSALEGRQLDAFAWLAVTAHGAEAAMIVLEQEGGLAPVGSAGLDADEVLPLIELCRRLRTGP